MTLKQLQAEWRETMINRTADDGWDLFNCCDALTPFILQQERDEEVIRMFTEALESIATLKNSPRAQCLAQETLARSRLKEME